jgi:hypothetical protein
MKKHTHEAFRILTGAYPTWIDRFSEDGDPEVWGSLVEEIPESKLLSAVRLLVRTSRFAPSVADIFEAAGVKPKRPPMTEEEILNGD